MKRSFWATGRRTLNHSLRAAVSLLPRDTRFALHRALIDCDPHPDPRLTLCIASTRDDLEACFSLLHDAYVASGFMKPDPSGLRVTPYHALPTTTTLCAKFDGLVVGTLSLVREGVFGFPLQSAFDLTPLRAQAGRIAEISALAVHPHFRKSGGRILFPLMKFMYEYCTAFFDTRHLVIAVNPNRIEMYESLLFFKRLQAQVVANYDFANGAPAVAATLDLDDAPEIFAHAYAHRSTRRNLHRYFTQTLLPHIHFPDRTYFTTNDPVMSPDLLDYFFNQRTQGFAQLDERKRRLLHSIYPQQAYQAALPPLAKSTDGSVRVRRHGRHSLKCPARLETIQNGLKSLPIEVLEISLHGFLARADAPLAERTRGVVCVQLGAHRNSIAEAVVIRRVGPADGHYYGFRIDTPDVAWQTCINELEERDNPAAANGAASRAKKGDYTEPMPWDAVLA